MLLVFAVMFLGALKIGAYYQNPPPPPAIVTPPPPTYTGNVYYLNSTGGAGTGDGSTAANAADGSTAAKHDAIVQAHLSNWTLIYAAGTYQTTGGGGAPNWGAFQPTSNFTIQGAGMDQTILQIAPGTITPTTGNNAAYGIFRTLSSTANNITFKDFTFDLNAGGQTLSGSASGSSYGISLPLVTNCTIQRVKFIHMGSMAGESFPLLLMNSSSGTGTAHNVLVDSCIFSNPTSGNTGGLTCINFVDSEPNSLVDTTCVVSNCQFLDLNNPFSGFQFAQCVGALIAQNCYARNVDAFWYIEPGSAGPPSNNVFFTGLTAQVTNNVLVNTGQMARFLMRAGGTFAGNATITNNTCWMSNSAYIFFGVNAPVGFSIEQFVSGTLPVGNVTFNNNVGVLQAGYSGTPLLVDVGQQGNQIQCPSLTANNNLMVYFPVGSGIAVNISGTVTTGGNNRRP